MRLVLPYFVPYRAGNDLNESITPVEAGLTWTIGKKRREACDFLGGEVNSPGVLPSKETNSSHRVLWRRLASTAALPRLCLLH